MATQGQTYPVQVLAAVLGVSRSGYYAWRRRHPSARAQANAALLSVYMRLGMEILKTGEVHVYRPDREWLLGVRNGLLEYEELLGLAAEYEARLAILQATSTLPEAPDVEQVETLVSALQEDYLWATRESCV